MMNNDLLLKMVLFDHVIIMIVSGDLKWPSRAPWMTDSVGTVHDDDEYVQIRTIQRQDWCETSSQSLDCILLKLRLFVCISYYLIDNIVYNIV